MIWRDIPGYEGEYQASDTGLIRSLITNRVLRSGLASNGYLTVSLRGNTRTVHSLVALTFIGLRPPRADVCHLDEDRRNNAITNLRYGTRAENESHKSARPQGRDHLNAKLDESAVREIRRLRGRVSQSELARRFRVSPAAVQAVHDGRTWGHVK